tara:strand:- start:1724 stop:2116 length:393 start_codon:yes stop_codon:yes gene_type:complete
MAYNNIMAGTEKQREEINRKLVSMQMEMIGLTYQDAMDTPEFWRVYTLTTEQTLEWRKVAIPLIKKTFKCNKRRAEMTLGMFELNLGLRVEDPIDTTHIHTTIPPEAHMLKDQQPTFLQKMKKFFRGYYD